MKFKFYSDPGHGWLAVKRKLVFDLNLQNTITAYSYQNGGTVYLEEDCDAAEFIQALKSTGQKYEIEYHDTNWKSPIRSYQRFSPV